jgi:hypothetical protein
MLNAWCTVSGAKFNMEKTEIIPISTKEYRQRVITLRKVNKLDQTPLKEQIHIAKDSKSIRMLGAWIENQTKDDAPWETIIDKKNGNLGSWKCLHPTLNRRKLIMQAIVGGYIQFLMNA